MPSKDIAPKVVRRRQRRKPSPHVTVRFPSEDIELLDRAAAQENVTRSDIVHAATMRTVRQILGLPAAA